MITERVFPRQRMADHMHIVKCLRVEYSFLQSCEGQWDEGPKVYNTHHRPPSIQALKKPTKPGSLRSNCSVCCCQIGLFVCMWYATNELKKCQHTANERDCGGTLTPTRSPPCQNLTTTNALNLFSTLGSPPYRTSGMWINGSIHNIEIWATRVHHVRSFFWIAGQQMILNL